MKRRWLNKSIRYMYAFLLLACLLATGTILFLSAGYYLSAQAGLPQKADAIVALGSNSEIRVSRTLEVFRQGQARNVLLIRPAGRKTRQQEFMRSGARPENIFFDTGSDSTYEEAINSLKLMKAQGWRHVLIVTDPPHIRRVDWTWRHVLKGTGLTYTLVATSPEWWDADHWWRGRVSRNFVISEFKKLVYYRLVYGTGLAGQKT